MNKSIKQKKSLNGVELHSAIVSGIQRVIADQDHLNKINVFPVPDGDTGTNMAFTMTTILDKTISNVDSRVDNMLEAVADAALDGARGNSGAILAQFFQGFSDGSIELSDMGIKDFATAMQTGSDYAREALLEPKEGTILTVIKDFSNYISELVENNPDNNFSGMLEKGIVKAEESLQNTPNLMDVLKNAGVVDAGAQGFVDFLTGMQEYINDENNIEINFDENKIISQYSEKISNVNESFEYRFCTECMIMGDSIDRKKLKESLMNNGDSMVIAGSKTKAKVHIHTNNPAQVFAICETFGIVKGQKADDMLHQKESASHQKDLGEIAIVTDSGADFIDDSLDIHVVPLKYNFGEKCYLDKVSQTANEFYNELMNNPNHPQTSQPSPGDFRRQYQFLNTHYKSIISIHIPQKLSGTLQSANTALKRIPDSKITVIDSLSISVGQGLIASYAAKLVHDKVSHNKIVADINYIITQTNLYASVTDLSYGVKGGRIPKSKQIISDLLKIKPVLTTGDDGTMKVAGVLFGSKNRVKKLTNLLLKKHSPKFNYNINIAHSECMNEANELVALLKNKYNNIQNIPIFELGCALGVHTGPGALVVGIHKIN